MLDFRLDRAEPERMKGSVLTLRLCGYPFFVKIESMRGLTEVLIDSMEDPVVVEDHTGRICYWNQAAERIFGYSKEEACLNHIDLLLPEEVKPDFSKFLKQVLGGKSFFDIETTRRTKDGREIDVIETMLPVKPEADVLAVVHLVRDPTDVRRKKALEVLSNQPQIALTLAHELRNPLSALNNVAYLLEHRMDSRYLPMMKKQLALCDSIITNLLEFTIAGKPERQQVSLQQLLDQVLSLVNIPPNVDLECSNVEMISLWVDPAQIRQTFLNLVHNAVEAIGEKSGKVEILIQEEPQFARIDFVDSGPGMSESVFKKLFQPLVTTKKKGMGLGLLTCKQLVEANGGMIYVENRRGHGMTFTVTLPKSRNVALQAG
jgi:PAS domain S-box-containing protein